MRYFLWKSLEKVWKKHSPGLFTKFIQYYKEVWWIICESDQEHVETPKNEFSDEVRISADCSEISTELKQRQPSQEIHYSQDHSYPNKVYFQISVEPEFLNSTLSVEPFIIIIDYDDTWNNAARKIQNLIKSRYFYFSIMKVVMINKQFQLDEEKALANRMKKFSNPDR